ncbi:MAG TPA: 5-oxoprolinase subunit PxpA [Actinomycetota bacterium]|nr:5-oxoprolinase subunit PxpA [Actinomycetota bacterium]
MDLNSDLGEGYGRWALGDDDALLEVVTSANVACGFHAGDPATIDRTVRTAVERGVRIGAQVSYPDLAGFGRRVMDVAPGDLTADVLYQLGALEAFARAAGSRVRYVKPHGALYNRIARDPIQAAAVVEAVRRYDPALPLLTLPGAAALDAARAAGIPVVGEGFADRAYTAEGRLVSRREPGAVLHDPQLVAARAVRMATEHRVESVDGSQVEVDVRSLCVHGDTPGAVDLARRVRAALEEAGVTLEPFA